MADLLSPSNAEEDLANEQMLQEDEEEEEEYGSETTTASGSESLSWISWFCSLPGHEYFCEVTEDFIEDDFNLTGLSGLVPFYKEALDMVLDVEPVDADLKVPDVSIVESSAELLYGLIHQRFIITRPGLAAMAHKYEHGHFGYCPRVYCSNTRVLPVGRSDLPGVDTVKLFCPSCVDIYAPPSSRFQGVDGSFFGTTLPHLLLHSYKDTAAGADLAPASYSGGRNRIYTPKIYGFRVSDRAKSGPRMMWLRMKPSDPSELDRIDGRGQWRTDPNQGTDDEGEEEEEDQQDDEDDGEQQQQQQQHEGSANGMGTGTAVPFDDDVDVPSGVQENCSPMPPTAPLQSQTPCPAPSWVSTKAQEDLRSSLPSKRLVLGATSSPVSAGILPRQAVRAC